MEACTPDFIGSLNRELPQNAVVNASFANFMLIHYQKENRLRRDIQITSKRDFDYYILLSRQNALPKGDRLLIRNNRNTFASVQLRGTPLISVYRMEGADQKSNRK